jgi:hypothetical protein
MSWIILRRLFFQQTRFYSDVWIQMKIERKMPERIMLENQRIYAVKSIGSLEYYLTNEENRTNMACG